MLGEETLFQASARLLSGQIAEGSAALSFESHVVLTNSDLRFIVTEQLQSVGIDPGAILIEPEARNAAPAVLAAALWAFAKYPEAVLLVAPSDHVVPDIAAFHAAVAKGTFAVAQGQLVTFGITSTRPETGYGYLELAQTPGADGAPVPLKKFVEKPDAICASAPSGGGGAAGLLSI